MRVGSRVRILALLPPASSAVDEPLGGRLLPVEDDAPSAEQHQPEGALAQIQAEKLDEVGAIMRLPEARDDGPLSMRLGYMAPETICSFSDAIRASSSQGRLGVAVDLKRSTVDASGVVMELRDPSSDLNAEASYLLSIGVDALIVSCGATRYGSSLSDLDMLAQVLRGQPTPGARPIAPPLLAKDFVVHPIQIAQMLEAGASAVLLVCGLVGPDLEQLLNSCTLMGVEALVEVHTPDEVLFAVECGATAILVNRRCRATGAFDAARPIQLGALIPGHVLSLATGGYCTHADGQTIDCRELEALLEAGYDGVIVGRALNSQAGPGESARRAQLVLAEIKRHQLEQRAVSWGSNLIL
ncbi:hypothetical protein KFE25_008954 [Diacronema lutheri]|uniref:indole-3-glycerol-phosphate synthase n=2 Tax=Diacronema lutheri TaxID=2081491 RepID=A0A8J5XRS8_DIALT|nr:hypothetical protein KFE25_008954 [Diacronema lutheri]